jgi:hypothetical protein
MNTKTFTANLKVGTFTVGDFDCKVKECQDLKALWISDKYGETRMKWENDNWTIVGTSMTPKRFNEFLRQFKTHPNQRHWLNRVE